MHVLLTLVTFGAVSLETTASISLDTTSFSSRDEKNVDFSFESTASAMQSRRELKDSTCETWACTSIGNDCGNFNAGEACASNKRCVLEGIYDTYPYLFVVKCHGDKKCNQIMSYPSHFQSYTYESGDPTTLPGGAAGPECNSACFTTDEPRTGVPLSNQGSLGLPWCYTTSNHALDEPFGYCFPSASPPCAWDNGYISTQVTSGCSLSCTDGYRGYAFAACYGQNMDAVLPSDPLSAGCTPILCDDVFQPELGVVGGTTDPCSAGQSLQAGTSCSIKCTDGYTMRSTSTGDIVTFDGNVACPSNGGTLEVSVSCSAKTCLPFTLPSDPVMTGEGVTNGCTSNQVLSTQDTCLLRCQDDNSADPYVWAVQCPDDADDDGNSPSTIVGEVSCALDECENFILDEDEIRSASVGGCVNGDPVRLNATCFVECVDGWGPVDGGANLLTVKCVEDAEGNLTYASIPECVPNTCAPFYFETGMTSATAGGCQNGTTLATNRGEDDTVSTDCFVSCEAGYSRANVDAFGGRVFCPSDAAQDSPVSYTISCTENSCAQFVLPLGIVGTDNENSTACTVETILMTKSNTQCGVGCDVGYAPSTLSSAVLRCDSGASQGALPFLDPSDFGCIENACAPIALGIGQIGISSSDTVACRDDLVLQTHSSPTTCAWTCDAGYVPSTSWSNISSKTLRCAQNASDGDVVENSLTCTRAVTSMSISCGTDTEGCEVSSSSIGLTCVEAAGSVTVLSSALASTEGGDVVTFENFVDDSVSTLSLSWFLLVDNTIGSPCVLDTLDDRLSCSVPPGSGVSQEISLVRIDNGRSETSNTEIMRNCSVTYAQPVISEVVGCASGGCERSGGDVITIRGANFGENGALAFVNGQECLDITTVSHRELSCIVPALETFQSQINHLVVIQSNQFGSGSLNYTTCSRGFSQVSDSFACVPCKEGTFTSEEDMFECLPCDEGTYSAVKESPSCLPCDANFFASGTGSTSCKECPGGKSSVPGSSTCVSCGWTYIGDPGHCDVQVFGILFGLFVAGLVITVVVCVAYKYAFLLTQVEEEKSSKMLLAKDIELLQSACTSFSLSLSLL